MRKLILLSFLLLAACTSTPPAAIDTRLASWQGVHIDELIQAWGLPSSERNINGVRYAEWSSTEVSQSPGVHLGVGGGKSRVFGSIGTTIFGGPKEDYCTRQVSYDDAGFVTNITWNGEPDVCDKAIPTRYQAPDTDA